MRLPIKMDGFLFSLVGVVSLAALWPTPGTTGGFLHTDWLSRYGVTIVFFFYGLTLAPAMMRAGLLRWPVHVVVQLGTFAVFPLLVSVVGLLVAAHVPVAIWLGFLYIAALPSTVSSSVAMTAMAKGNVPVAIFNASLSSLLGVFMTPLLMASFISTTGGSMPLGPVVGQILLLVLLPTAVGLVMQRWLRGWVHRHAGIIKLVDRGVILAIVYNSFCDSVGAGVWSRQSPKTIILITAGAIALFFAIYAIMKLPCRVLRFSREDTIACLFCASKKSLATGVPLARIIFGATPALGLIIAPLMIFHFCQLVIVSALASAYAREV
ncbi:MAG: bile acid:sodium symporter [Gammaproteobacteria bacterium]|nr:bile acid:sodium symporter [Gammaproteobacteria bacterium]